MKDLRDRVAFITGGASGIGFGVACALIDAGMKVVIADLRQDHIDEALSTLESSGRAARAHAIRVDVTDRAAMAAAADETERVFGNLHVLFNNAGVGIQGPFKGITYADWDFGLAVNLGGVVNGLQTFLPRIRAHGEGGYIINTASLAALVTMPAHFVIYATAKAAVIALSETIRPDLLQENIGVSVLLPGPVRSKLYELQKNRPPQFGVGEAFREYEATRDEQIAFPGKMEPHDVGALVLNAMRTGQPYIITHGEWREAALARHTAIIDAMPKQVDPALRAMLRARAIAAAKST